MKYSASRELLAPRADVWAFLAEPYHLSDWWPGLGVEYQLVRAPGISEDVALLLAYEKGAELIVAVGTHFNLIEFLERNRAGMSSTFVTRLKVGEILIDAKGVSRLVSRRVGLMPLVTFALTGLAAIVVAIVASPTLRRLIGLLTDRLRDLLGFA